MAILPRHLQDLVGRAALSLVAWQVVETLADRPSIEFDLAAVVGKTGFDVAACSSALAALQVTRLVKASASGFALSDGTRDDVVTLVVRCRCCRATRLAVLKTAVLQDLGAWPIRLRVTWAPDHDNAIEFGGVPASVRPEFHSLASTVHAARAPNQSADRAAPAA
jgi:hypothetical protein